MRGNDNQLWLSSQDAFFVYSQKEDLFKNKPVKTNISNKHPFIITKLNSLDSTSMLIGTKYHGALKFNFKENELEPLLKNEKDPVYIRDFAVSENNEIWMATESGLFIYNTKEGTYINLKKNYNDRYALTDNALYDLTIDREGGVWIGTYFGGINYYSQPHTPFKKYFPKIGENSISGNAIREIHEDKYGKLWIGTEDAGLNRFNPETGKFFNIPKRSLSHYNIHGILPRGEELWVGTFEHGLDILDIKTGERLRHYSSNWEEGSLKSDFIVNIFETKNKEIYVLTSYGIQRYNVTDDKFEVVKEFPHNSFYACFEEDSTGVLWAGTHRDGLFYFNPETLERGSFKQDYNDRQSLNSNVINGIFEDSQKNLWVTTENGLNLYNRKNQSFKRFHMKDGLPSNMIYSMLEDDNGYLWISTSSGLACMNPKTYDIVNYTRAKGLLSDQFNYSSAYKDKKGTMYFGSVFGMISFNPKNFTKNNYDAPTLFTGIQIDNREVVVNGKNWRLTKSISLTDELELEHYQSTFNLQFSKLAFSAPEMTEYAYRVQGLNDKWNNIGKNNKVYFTQLPAGEYNLQIKSKGASGMWSDEITSLAIKIMSPFWFSKSAYLLYFLLAGTILFFIIRYYQHYIKNRHQQKLKEVETRKEKEIYQAKIAFFTNVVHEIRTPLTLIKAPLEKLLKTEKEPKKIEESIKIMDRNTTRLLDLVNQLLDFRKTETGNLKLSFIEVNIAKLIKEIHLRFKPVIDEKKIKFDLRIEKDPLYAYVDKEAIRKILSNLFNNAIKYCEQKVVVKLGEQGNHFEVSVENDGQLIHLRFLKKFLNLFLGSLKTLVTLEQE